MLVNWLLSSISESMFIVISKCLYFVDMWITLEKEFLIESRTKTLHVKYLLQNTKKDNLSIHDYFVKMKGFIENPLASGIIVMDEELMNYIMDGLSSKYDVVVVNITTCLESRLDPLTVQEAQIILQKYEPRLEKENLAMNSMINNEFHGSLVHLANISTDMTNKKYQNKQSDQLQFKAGQS
ncbi:uncharacterized protein LOC116121796 [Pistacia vera]|uniref:uncharacterized protein LOC116121796 n=1 Tax=Pistacia vera TaxID=55513 RepID=UPI001262E4D2|nr:uncharacterized protein LOC116121796 [Pistacia vera]